MIDDMVLGKILIGAFIAYFFVTGTTQIKKSYKEKGKCIYNIITLGCIAITCISII
ncbi:hypothetical protein LMG33818_000855 [Halomonadaceae bacterium LMG 33818]